MLDYPQTRADAEAYRYNTWAGNPDGWPFDPTRCAAEIQESGRAIRFYQCCRKPGNGPDGLYCGIHAKKASKKTEGV